MRVILTGGGTGGHIFPALEIARELQARWPDVTLLYVGTPDGLEAALVPRAGLDFLAIPVQGLVGKAPRDLARGLWVLGGALYRAWRQLRAFRPDVVVGTGGYVSGPILLSAVLQGIPTLIQEQNVFPGVTNRLLSRWVGYVAIPHAAAAAHFPRGARLVVTGNPVRREIIEARREAAARHFGADLGKLQLLIIGGSRGAQRLNEAVLAALPELLADLPVEITWVTGRRYFDQIKAQLAASGIETEAVGKLRLEGFLHDIHLAYALADVFIGRAGAMTLAEITVRGIPSILIPSPNVTHDHQTYNARALAQAGAALVISEAELSGEVLARRIKQLAASPATLRLMGQRSRAQGRPQAVQAIVELIAELAGTRRPGAPERQE